MTKQEIISKVKALNLPQGSYIVFGAAPLAIYGIREANDIDLLVNENVIKGFREAGWQQASKGPLDHPYQSGDIEAHPDWKFSPYSPTLDQLLKTATVVDGVSFASLAEVRKWKMASGRPKDTYDLQLIDDYNGRKVTAEVLAAWLPYTKAITDWRALVKGVAPKATDCGPVYELPNPIERPYESFAIADMRGIKRAEPHYHANGEIEIYVVLSGTGKVVVGSSVTDLMPGTVSVTLADTAHYAIPENDLVLAVINTPPFNAANAVSLTADNPAVGFSLQQFTELTQS